MQGVPAAQRGGNAELQRSLRGMLSADGLVRALVLMDAQGRTLASTTNAAVPLPAVLPSWFKQLFEPGARKLAIGRNEKGPGGQWVLPVSRLVQGANGDVEGVLLAHVDAGYVQPLPRLIV